ncbi:MAG TPA: cadmium-translocating P-type ATPase [Clostridiales bacterium]|jgi:Cd2+/Zn2+-exporting ATPase|nr:cadmium-translocating P-type ATPase [Clostridiales bacterium]
MKELRMKKYKYNINNLDCANCARKIEEILNKNKELKNAIVNFNTSKISYEAEREFSIKELNDIIKTVEPDAYVTKEENKTKKEFHLSILIIALAIGLLGYFMRLNNTAKMILYIVAYTLLLYRTGINAVKLLFKNKTINENMLITISCIGALAIGEVVEGMLVIALYTIGKILEEKAVNNSRKSIKDLIDIKQPYANLKQTDEIKKVDVEEIKINDILVVKKGEKIPVDGIVITGETMLDTSALTGESELMQIKEGDQVLSGSMNMGEIIEIKATQIAENSTVSKILELLEDATDKKTKTETIVSKISKIYTPIVIILALLIVICLPIIFNIPMLEAIHRGLTFLVISCPCAIAISVPLSYFTGIGVASKKGILIKGSNYLDALDNTKNIVFDKTGTLTNGAFTVTNIEIFDKDYTENQVIDILIKGESFSNHPIAKSIMNLKNEKVNNDDVKKYQEIEGKGITFELNDKKISIGNKLICNCEEDAILHLNIDGKHIASVFINDGIKNDAKETIEELKKQKIKTFMFTGDKKETALNIGKKLNIDEIKYEMLPTDKFEEFEKVSSKNELTIFVGDGINDAPVLKRADIGISMGGVGTDSAIEASDIVLMSDDLKKIPVAIQISKYTKNIIRQNLVFSISMKIIILLLSVLGFANMWLAVFADTGLTLLTILNTLRIMKRFA